MKNHVIEPKRVMEHYEIYVDGQFELSCDIGELSEALAEVESQCETNKFQKVVDI